MRFRRSSLLVLISVATAALGYASRVQSSFGSPYLAIDELYYLNISVTAARGLGLYPAAWGFEPMPAMGGIGYGVYLYVAAVRLLGPSGSVLRAVAQLSSLVALIPIYLIAKRWYGPASGLVSAGLAPLTYLFLLSNSARMDAITIAYTAWSLFAVVYAFNRSNSPDSRNMRWHFLAGAAFSLGLQVHLDTIVSAAAVGMLYLTDYVERAVVGRRWLLLSSPLVAYLLGYLSGGLLFLGLNVLPDPQGFFQPITTYHVDFSLATLLEKERLRYFGLAQQLPLPEAILWLAAIMAAVVRRAENDIKVLSLILAALVFGAAIFPRSSLEYLTHVYPLISLPVGPLVTHGFKDKSVQDWSQVHYWSFGVLVLAGVLLGRPLAKSLIIDFSNGPNPVAQEPAVIQQVRNTVPPGGRIAGPMIAFQFMTDYPEFLTTNYVEYQYGMQNRGISEPVQYWETMYPDLVFMVGSSSPRDAGVAEFVDKAGYVQVAPEIWVRPSLVPNLTLNNEIVPHP